MKIFVNKDIRYLFLGITAVFTAGFLLTKTAGWLADQTFSLQFLLLRRLVAASLRT